MGLGAKCHNSSRAVRYGERYGADDSITIAIDFDEHMLEFERNGISQGLAYDDVLQSPLYLAVSMTAKDAQLQIVEAVHWR